jgi:hypothetical protein
MTPCSYDFAPYFFDPNGDYLTFTVPDPKDITMLNTYNMKFSRITQILSGTPPIIGYISMIEVTATDPYGLSTSLYFSVIITQSQPSTRIGGDN